MRHFIGVAAVVVTVAVAADNYVAFIMN